MTPLRILVAHDVPRARTGGMARIMGFLHDPLTAAGHTVDWFDAESMPAHVSGRRRRRLFGRRLRQLVADAARHRKPWDIVNVHEPVAAPLLRPPRPSALTRVVVTSHGLEARALALAAEEARLGRAAPGVLRRVARRIATVWPANDALRRADHVFCLNEQDRAWLAKHLGVPEARTTCIQPGAGPAYAAAAEGRRYDVMHQVVFAGTWRKNKGIEDLVPAFASVAEDLALTLCILGSGVPEHEVQRAFPAPVRQRVRVLPRVDDHAAAAELAASDVFLLPSLFEGTPLTLIEAMASGLPIITTDTCGMRDVIRNGETGILVPIRAPGAIADALRRLARDADLRRRLGTAAREDAQARYRWDRQAAPVRRAYEALAGA